MNCNTKVTVHSYSSIVRLVNTLHIMGIIDSMELSEIKGVSVNKVLSQFIESSTY